MIKQVINTSSAPKAVGTYSQAVKVGHTVYLSGQIAIDPATQDFVSGDFKVRVRQIFKNLAAVADAAGASLSSVVKFTIYLINADDFPMVNEVIQELLEEPYPARSTVIVAALPKGADVEVDAILTLSQ